MRKIVKHLAGLGMMMLISGMVYAQDPDPIAISLSSATAQNDDTVELEFDFVGNNESSSLGADINYDPTGIADIDLDNCLDGTDAFISTCVFPGGGDHTGGVIRVTLAASGSADNLGDFTGKISVELDGTLSDGSVIDFEWSGPLAEGPDADVESTDGSITIEAAADDESTLAVTPDDYDFAQVEVGDSETTVFTAENTGDADLEITDVTIAGDAQFNITDDNCDGETLGAGDTCDVEVTFSPDSEDTFNAEITFESDADNNDTIVVQVTGEGVEDDNGAEEGFTVDFDGGLGSGDAGQTLDSTGTVDYVGDTSGSLSCSLSGDLVFSSDPDPLDFTFAESGSEEFTIYCDLPEDADDGQDYGGALSCTDENDEVVYSGELSCSVTTDEPEPTPAVPVPTMQSWGIALFSLIMLAIGGLSIRAFRS